MGDNFFSNLESTFLSFASNIAVISAWILLIFEYVVAEDYMLSKSTLIFSIRCHDRAHDHEHDHHDHHYHNDDNHLSITFSFL